MFRYVWSGRVLGGIVSGLSRPTLRSLSLWGLGLAGCIPTASRIPLETSATDEHDSYYYGTALPFEVSETTDETPTKAKLDVKPERASKKSDALVEPVSTLESEEEGVDKTRAGDAGVQSEPVDFSGEFRGTDYVVIALPGFPEGEQVDEKAQVVIDEDSDGKFRVRIIDSSAGTDLCGVLGSVSGSMLRLEPGQECFASMLGVSVETELLAGGKAELKEDGQLAVSFEVSMDLEGPQGQLSGRVKYRFEGARR